MVDFEFNELDTLCQDNHRDYTSIIVQPEKYSLPSSCPHCGCSIRQEISHRYPGTNITKRAAAWIKAFLNAKFPVSQIEDITGIHWNIIRKIQEELISQALNEYENLQVKNGYKPKYLAIDEFAIRKMHKYATCVKGACYLGRIR